MKFNVENAPEIKSGLCLGAVYPSYNKRCTKFWVVVAIREDGGVTVLGLNSDGEVTCARDYAMHVFCGGPTWEGRPKVGQCKNFGLTFDIEWGAP